MALRNPPSWLQNGSHPAENDRLTTQAFFNTTGIIGTSSLQVVPNSPVGMSVLVNAGWGAVVGTTQPLMGTYVIYNDGATALTIGTANPTNPRIDRIVATVQDAYYTGANNNVIFQVIAGTPAASPTAPATPANSISLATILVTAGATSISAGNITDTRVSITSNVFTTLNGTETFTNKTLVAPIIVSAEERTTISATAATGTINFDALTQAVLYYTNNASANFTLNIRGNASTTLNSMLAVGDSITVAFLNTNGTTAYYPTVFQIDGSAITPKWIGGNTPSSGNASSIDAYTYTIIKTAATPTYIVLASQVKYA